jgi:NADH-quinone oxidoreductase subunit F
MQFTQNESCGKCVPCREGTKQMLLLLDDIIEGRGTEQTLIDLEDLTFSISTASLCGLGKTAPNPVASTLNSFREEYEAHIFGKCCPAGQCRALTPPAIDPELCIGCTACTKVCPVDAITGERKTPHVIDTEKCIRCGACAAKCKFNAIAGVK